MSDKIIKPVSVESLLHILEREGFIKIIKDDLVIMRQKFIQFAVMERKNLEVLAIPESDENERWEEFKSTYPKKDGKRPLHNNSKVCREKYIDLTKDNEPLHNTIILALKAELSDREEAGWRKEFRPHWKLMSTYINQESWTMYADYEDVDNEDKGDSYGATLI